MMRVQHTWPDAAPVIPPELVFRGMLPSESLLNLARAQDALCRGLAAIDGADSKVVIETLPHAVGVMHRATVTLHAHSVCAEHRSAEQALCMAYTQLLRSVTEPSTRSMAPCACAA